MYFVSNAVTAMIAGAIVSVPWHMAHGILVGYFGNWLRAVKRTAMCREETHICAERF